MTTAVKFLPEKTVLSPSYRAQLLDRLEQGAHYDMVIAGAGVTGAGVALDAASRGLSVLLVDAHDLAFGTSRWSSKLAHGGLRYLASGNVGIARRSAVERGAMMETIAPHLTRALAQVVAVHSFNPLNFIPRVGFAAGDILRIAAGTSSATLPRSRTISAAEVARLCPGVAQNVKFGFVNYDGQLIDDARLVTALARTAAGFGADVLTHARVDVQPGRVEGLKQVTLSLEEIPAAQRGDTPLQDTPQGAGAHLRVTAAGVVNATGVWAGELEKDVTVTPSRGTHVVVDAAAVGNPHGALTVAVPGSINRFCFILPEQLGRCYIGLTDEHSEFEDVPHAPESDIQWILGVVNRALATKLTKADVKGAFAGLRPLVQFQSTGAEDKATSTADLSREHLIMHKDGLVTVTGGKLTEYRLMAQQTVDEFLQDPHISGATHGAPGACRTKEIPLVGAAPSCSPSTPAKATSSSERPSGNDLPESLVQRYGAEAANVYASCTVPDPLGSVAGLDITRAELAYAVTHEGAVTVEDILDRRTRIGLVPVDRAAALPVAEEILSAVYPS